MPRRDAGNLVTSGRTRLAGEQQRFNRMLARHEHRPLVALAVRIVRRDRESAGTVVGSAVAFRLFLFFVPLLLFLVGLLGIVATWVDAEDVHEQTAITGSLADQIDSALSQPGSSRWIATILGLFGMATAGRSLSKVLVSASCLAWRLPVQGKASMRIVGGIVGLVAGVGLVAVIVNRIRADLGLAATGLSFLAAVVVYGLAWLALSMILPRATHDPGALLPGAALVGLTIAGMQAISQLYLPNRLGQASELYGAIGSTVVTLGWFFFLGRAMVLAMVLDAVIHEHVGTISQAVFSLPVVRILPRRSAWIRRFFDLDT
ncbi:MAG TPA: YhjD/YihY/BrkB family envelope integrity protein, partial [Acidimicrobiales bacterium]|nr:YhjD/YihY/BrkB family envelope integrity protein [Acidimicrobiales bacterium]